MALISDVVAGQPIEPSWGNAIRDQTVQRSTTSTRPPSPAEGAIMAATDKDRVEHYSGSAWIPGMAYGSAGRVGWRVRRTSTSTIADSSGPGPSLVFHTTEDVDTDNQWDTSTGQATITVPGLYVITIHARWDSVAPGTDARHLLWINGAAFASAHFANVAFSMDTLTVVHFLANGDTVKHLVTQMTGSNKTLGAQTVSNTSDPIGPYCEAWRFSA